MNEELDDDVCVACESANVEKLAEGAYQCRDCGYEGGSKYDEYVQRREREAMDELSSAEARDRAIAQLEEVNRLANSASVSFDGASTENLLDLVGVGGSGYATMDGEGTEAMETFSSGLRYLLEAQAVAEDAAYLIGEELPEELRVDVELGFAQSSLDTLADGALWDLMTQHKIHRANEAADAMVEWSEARLERCRGGATDGAR